MIRPNREPDFGNRRREGEGSYAPEGADKRGVAAVDRLPVVPARDGADNHGKEEQEARDPKPVPQPLAELRLVFELGLGPGLARAQTDLVDPASASAFIC